MFFKPSLKIIIFAIAIFSIGCDLKIGDKPLPKKVLKVEQNTCFKGMGDKIEAFTKAKLSGQQITQLMSCVEETIEKFEKRTVGKNHNVYAPVELQDFLQRYIFPDKDVTTDFISSLMQIKVAFVGGEDSRLTRDELLRTVNWLGFIKENLLRIQPYVAILNPSLKTSLENSKKLEEATDQLHIILNNLAAKAEKEGGGLNLEALVTLLQEYNKFADGADDKSDISKYADLIISFKSIAVGGDKSFVSTDQWGTLAEEAYQWFKSYLTYNYSVKDKNIYYGPGLKSLIQFADSIISNFEKAIQNQDKSYISFEQFDELIDNLERAELLPSNVRAFSAKHVLRPLFAKIFGDLTTPIHLRANNGLDRVILTEMEQEFYKWADIQRSIEKAHYLASENYKAANQKNVLKLSIFSIGENADTDSLDLTAAMSKIENESKNYGEFLSIAKDIRPLYRVKSPKVILANEDYLNSNNIQKNYYHLSLINMFRSAVRLAVRGYSTDIERAQKMHGLTEDELEYFTSDFLPIFEDLNILDPNAKNAGRKMFLQANLFTYSGNGIQPISEADPSAHLLTVNEAIEYIAYLYSSYTINTYVYGRLLKTDYKDGPIGFCPKEGVDIFHRPVFNMNCFYRHLKGALLGSINNMPGMFGFVSLTYDENYDKPMGSSRIKQISWQEFTMLFTKTVVKSNENPHRRGLIHLGKFTMIMHFVETIMTKYDLNSDKIVDTNEIEIAYNDFEYVIYKLINQIKPDNDYDDEMRKDIFMYALKNGKFPEGGWDYFWSSKEVERLERDKILTLLSDITKDR